MSAFGPTGDADLLRTLVQGMQDLTEAVRGQTGTVQRASEQQDRIASTPVTGLGGGGLLGQTAAGLGGAGALGAASGFLGGGGTAPGQVLGGAAATAGAARLGMAAGGPAGAAAAGGLAALQAIRDAGAVERSFEQQMIRLSDPTLNPVQAELEREQARINRDPTTGARNTARGAQTAVGGFLGGPLAGVAGRAAERLLGPDPQLALEQRRIDEAPQARALARLQAEAGQIARFGGELTDEQLELMQRNFLGQEERFQASQRQIQALFGTEGDRRRPDE